MKLPFKPVGPAVADSILIEEGCVFYLFRDRVQDNLMLS